MKDNFDGTWKTFEKFDSIDIFSWTSNKFGATNLTLRKRGWISPVIDVLKRMRPNESRQAFQDIFKVHVGRFERDNPISMRKQSNLYKFFISRIKMSKNQSKLVFFRTVIHGSTQGYRLIKIFSILENFSKQCPQFLRFSSFQAAGTEKCRKLPKKRSILGRKSKIFSKN